MVPSHLPSAFTCSTKVFAFARSKAVVGPDAHFDVFWKMSVPGNDAPSLALSLITLTSMA